MTTAVLITARMGSQRLPGKALLPLAGQPMLRWVCDRAAQAGYPVAVLVPDTPANADLATAVETWDYRVIRGPSEPTQDVLTLFTMGCDQMGADLAVRVTGDCPLLDPFLIEEAVQCVHGEIVYASNTIRRTFARGLDVEAMDGGLVAGAHRRATKRYDREHVTPWMQRYVQRRKWGAMLTQAEDTEARWQWSVDTADDLAWVQRIADTYTLLTGQPGLPSALWLRTYLHDHPDDIHWDRPALVVV